MAAANRMAPVSHTPQPSVCHSGADTPAAATPGLLHRLKWMLAGLLPLLYLILVYLACVYHAPSWWTLLPLFAPLVWWAGTALAQRCSAPFMHWALPLALLGLLTLGTAWLATRTADAALSPHQVRWLYFLQETTLLWLMGGCFGWSLLPGRQPLCTVLATAIHREMTPRVVWYTRHVTRAWALWILGIWLVSALLFFLAAPATWALFSSMSPVLMGTLFAAEALARRHFLPPQDRPALLASLQTVRKVDWLAIFRKTPAPDGK